MERVVGNGGCCCGTPAQHWHRLHAGLRGVVLASLGLRAAAALRATAETQGQLPTGPCPTLTASWAVLAGEVELPAPPQPP